MTMKAETRARSRVRSRVAGLRGLFAKRDNPYAGADLENAKRLGALLLVMDGGLSLALFPVAPPNDAIGNAGWVVASCGVALLFLAASRLLASKRVTFNELLVITYPWILQVAVFEWLAGGHSSPYGNLYLLPIVFAAGIHPARRLAPVLGAVAVANCAPLVYESWTGSVAADIGVQLLLWFTLAGAMMALMAVVRGQRLTLREEEAAAQRLARVDSLTGLGNRRGFDEALAGGIARARRAGSPLSVVILDIDDFKEINDGFGHLNGDRCLRDVAARLSEAARAGDTVFRWGGDEFAVLLPESSYEGAMHVADRMQAVVARSVRRPDGQVLTISCGAAELTEAANADDFLAAADLALLSLKTPSATLQLEVA
jgi:diguanylate cyclase (GGDEF)-like protein